MSCDVEITDEAQFIKCIQYTQLQPWKEETLKTYNLTTVSERQKRKQPEMQIEQK